MDDLQATARDAPQPGLTTRPETGGWASATFGAFAEKAYPALWANAVLTVLGVVMSITTQTIVAFDLTGTNRTVGALVFVLGLPMLFLTPVAGALADRFSKRLLLLLSQGIMAGTMLGLGLLLEAEALTLPRLLAGAFVTGASLSMLGPVQMAYVGQIVAAERVGNAAALVQAGLNLVRVIGPFLVAGLVSWELVGSAGSFLIVAGILVLAMAPLLGLPGSAASSGGRSTLLGDVLLGVRHVLEDRRLFQLVVGFVVMTLVGFAYFVVLPRFADNVLGAGNSGYGVLVGVSSCGGLAASVVVASFADSSRAPLFLTVSGLAFGAALVVTGFAPTFVAALAAMLLVGAGSSAFQTLSNAVILRAASPAYFGRVVAIMNMAWSLTNLVGLPVGLLADGIGERQTLAALGATLCAVAGLLALWRMASSPARV